MKTLYHPNALPAYVREQLPNPSRPIDERVVPATVSLFNDRFDPIYQDLAESFSLNNSLIPNPLSNIKTVESILNFLKSQQNQSLENGLNLADFVKIIRPLGQAVIKTVVKNHPDFYPNFAETSLLMTAQFWQNLLALFLLAQCPTRKTLNHDLTLQILSEQITTYLSQHQREVEFLTFHQSLTISPANVAFAILALGGKLSKTGAIGERVTNLSANNFLSKF